MATFSRRSWSLVAALGASLVACAEPAAPANGVYVGAVGDLFVAAIAADDEVTLYACDGRDGVTPVRVALHGTLSGGSGTLTNEKYSADLDFRDDRVSGVIDTGAGSPLEFSAAPATGDAGLWWGVADMGDERAGGWVVDAAGEVRGAVLNRNKGDVNFVPFSAGGTVSLSDGATITPELQLAPNPAVQ